MLNRSLSNRFPSMHTIIDDNVTEKVGEKDIEAEYSRRPRSSFPHNVSMALRTAQVRLPRASAFLVMVRRCLFFLLPSFVQSKIRPDRSKIERVHPTAYLDGMRGIAAFAVYICHISYQCFVITIGFGQGDQGDNYRPIQLPFIRLFYSGPPAVAIFFVISGYALSYKPVRQMRAKQYDGLLATLSSSTFRRPFRLFIPCIISTFCVLLLIQGGAYDYTRFVAEDPNYLRHILESHPWRAEEFMVQFWDWAYKIFDFVHTFDFAIFGGSIDFDRHLWTIPVEFRASMVLFLTLFAVARMAPWLRVLSILCLSWWGIHWDRWELLLFWFGTILAEFDQMKNETIARYGQRSSSSIASQSERYWKWFFIGNFVVGLYLMSYPDEAADTTPGFIWLESQIPAFWLERYRFWHAVGAVQVIWATNNVADLKNLFNGPAIQYLGKLSYALYLCHGPVIHTAGYLYMAWAWSITGMEERFQYEQGFFIAFVLTTMTLIWAADIFWRLFDVNCVAFARWAETRLLTK